MTIPFTYSYSDANYDVGVYPQPHSQFKNITCNPNPDNLRYESFSLQ